MFDKKITAEDGLKIRFPGGNGVITHVCCDCGATHNVEVIPSMWRGGGFTLIFHRNKRSTGQFRRYIKLKKTD